MHGPRRYRRACQCEPALGERLKVDTAGRERGEAQWAGRQMPRSRARVFRSSRRRTKASRRPACDNSEFFWQAKRA